MARSSPNATPASIPRAQPDLSEAVGAQEGRHDERDNRERRQHVGEEPHPPDFPVAAGAEPVPDHEAGIEKRRQEGRQQTGADEEDDELREPVEAQRRLDESAQQSCTEQRLAGIAHEPAEHHADRHAALNLHRDVRHEHRRQDRRPRPDRREEKAGEEEGVRRPQGRDRSRVERQGEACQGSQVVPQCDEGCRPPLSPTRGHPLFQT
jgi:hypothetical protein